MTSTGWLAGESESTIALAESVSLAVLIEPALLRRARLELTGSPDAGVEADVWFSSFVASGGPDGIVFYREAAEVLRDRLAASKPRLQASWNLLRELHANASPALRLEEEIAWLLADGRESAIPRIRQRLRRAIATLVGGERTGLAHWAIQAIHRLPRPVIQLEEVRMLDAAARLRLGEPLDDESLPEWMSWVTPQRTTTAEAIAIRVFPGVLELELLGPASPEQHDNAIVVPGLRPLTIDVDAGDGPETVVVEEHGTTLVRIGEQPVRIRTSDRALYEVVPARSSERQLKRQIIGFSELLGGYEPRLVLPELLALLKAGSKTGGAAIVLTGIAGSGKTAVLNQLASERRAGLIQHFFSNRTHRWRDVALAARSLAAQAELLLPRARVTASSAIERLGQFLHAADPSGRPLLIVLDGLDEASPRGVEALLRGLFGDGVPSGVALVCSCNTHAPIQAAVTQVLGSTATVIDLAEPRWRESLSRAGAEIASRFGTAREAKGLLDARFAAPWSESHSARTGVSFRVPRTRLDTVLSAISGVHRPTLSDAGDFVLCRVLFSTSDAEGQIRALEANGALDILDEPIVGSVSAALARLAAPHRNVLGVIAAAREPLTKFRIAEAAGVSSREIEAVLRSLGDWLVVGRTPDHEETFAPLHERLRKALEQEVSDTEGDAASSKSHEGLLRTVAAWSTEDRGEFQREYALRYALAHAVVAADKRTRDRLLVDLDFLEARCALDGPASLIDELAMLAPHASRLAGTIRHALVARRDWLTQDPSAVRFVVQAALRNAALDVEPQGAQPGLRLRHPLTVPDGVDIEHRAAIAGCLHWDTQTRLSWAADGAVHAWTISRGPWALASRFHDGSEAIAGAVELPREQVAWGSRDGTVRVALHGERESRLLIRHDAAVVGLTTARPGDVVSWDALGGIRVTEAKIGELIRFIRTGDVAVTACVVDGDRAYAGSADGTIRMWRDLVGEFQIDLSDDNAFDGEDDDAVALRAVNRAVRDGLRAGQGEIAFPAADASRPGPIARLKVIAGLDLAERRVSQRGRVRAQVDGKTVHLTVTTFPEGALERATVTVETPEPSAVALGSHADAVTSLLWSDSFGSLFSTSMDGTARVWDVRTATEIRVLRGHESAVLGCLAVPDTTSVLTWSRDHTLRLWDVDSAAEIRRFTGHTGAVLGARVLSNGAFLSWSFDRTLRLWTLDSATPRAVFEGHAAAVTGALEHGPGVLASCSEDRTMLEWEVDESSSSPAPDAAPPTAPRIVAPRAGIGVSREAVIDCAIDPDNRVATLVTREGLSTLDLSTGKATYLAGASEGGLLGMAAGVKGSDIVTWSARDVHDWRGDRVAVTEARQGEHIDVVLPLENRQIVAGVRDSDGGWLNVLMRQSMMRTVNQSARAARVNWLSAVGRNEFACGWTDGAVDLCSAHPGYPILFRGLGSHAGASLRGVASADGRWLVTAGADLTARIWIINDTYSLDAAAHARLEGHTDEITGVAITPDAQRVITTSRDRTIRICHMSDGRLLRVLREHRDWVTHLAVNPDGTRMTTVSADRSIKLWSLDSYECLGTAYGESRFLCLAMSGDTVCAGDAGGNLWVLDYQPAASAAERRVSPRDEASAPKVFICHSATGDPAAMRLIDTLYQALEPDYACLIDRSGVGVEEGWRDQVNSWLLECDAAVVVLNHRALSSQYVAYEVSVLARRWREGRGAFRLIPVHVKDPGPGQSVGYADLQASALGPSELHTIQAEIYDPASDPTGEQSAGRIRSALATPNREA